MNKMIKYSLVSLSFILGIVLIFNLSSKNAVYSTKESSNGQSNQDIIDDYKINIEVYYETKCPDSKLFINNQLSKIFESLQNLTNLFLIPYGKAKYKWVEEIKSWEFMCQHGEEECYGNMLHNCLIHYYPKFNQHFQFINCTISNLEDDLIQVAQNCSSKYSINFDNLNKCANGSLGNQLLHGSGILTESLKPKLTYVPWIIINNHFSEINQDKAETDLIQFICKNSKAPFIDTVPLCKRFISKRRDFESLRNNLIENRNKYIQNKISDQVFSSSSSLIFKNFSIFYLFIFCLILIYLPNHNV